MVASVNDLLFDWLIWNNDDAQRHVFFRTIMANLFNSSFSWLPSKWCHKLIKIIVIGFWNTSFCKILVIFFLFIVRVITDRGVISSESPFTLEIINFLREGKRWEIHYHDYLFSSGIVRITKTSFILGLLVV